MTYIISNLEEKDFPVLLHTQAESYRAIKLYPDFGFKIVTNKNIGSRRNDYKEALPLLENRMKIKDFNNLSFGKISEDILKIINSGKINEF